MYSEREGPGNVWKTYISDEQKNCSNNYFLEVMMQGIIVLIIAVIILYFLVIGGILIWPLINVVAYLKVLIFPWAVRKKYGSSVAVLSNDSFDQEITDEDYNEVKKLRSLATELNSRRTKLHNELGALGDLSRNNDGSISQRSKAGKEGQRLTDEIYFIKQEIETYVGASRLILQKPHVAWTDWSRRYGRYLGNRDSIIFMAVGFPVFFFILGQFNLLELNYPTFENLVEIYIYVTFVAPVSDILDISLFKEGFFSLFISYDYAIMLTKNYDKVYTLYNWMVASLPMPILTLLVYVISKSIHVNKTTALEPKKRQIKTS